MKLSQYWRDVLGSASAIDKTCGSILNSLKMLNQAARIVSSQDVVETQKLRSIICSLHV